MNTPTEIPSWLTTDTDAMPITANALHALSRSLEEIHNIGGNLEHIDDEQQRKWLRESLTDALKALAEVETYDDTTIAATRAALNLNQKAA